jgi:hypothetical protein
MVFKSKRAMQLAKARELKKAKHEGKLIIVLCTLVTFLVRTKCVDICG